LTEIGDVAAVSFLLAGRAGVGVSVVLSPQEVVDLASVLLVFVGGESNLAGEAKGCA